jgi:hypothetical protein
MSSWKCHHCGLVNFAEVTECRRCQASLAGGTVSPNEQGNFQVNRAPQVARPQASGFAPQTGYQTGKLADAPPSSQAENSQHNQGLLPEFGQQSSPYAGNQTGGYASQPFNTYQAPQNQFRQNSGYQANNGNAQNHPYQQNDGYAQSLPYQQTGGQAYPNGGANGFHNGSQAYASHPQAAAYGAPPAGVYQAAYNPGYGSQIAGVWRDDKRLVMHKDAQLPDRCIKCNAPTQGFYLSRKISWMHPGWFALVLLGLLGWVIFAILSMTLKKRAVVSMGICEQHLSSRRTNMIMGWAVSILGLVFMIMAFSTGKAGVVFLGFVMLIGGACIASMAANIITVAKMDDQYIWMTRVSKDYLAGFPTSGSF